MHMKLYTLFQDAVLGPREWETALEQS